MIRLGTRERRGLVIACRDRDCGIVMYGPPHDPAAAHVRHLEALACKVTLEPAA
jgi:hypothetical protein